MLIGLTGGMGCGVSTAAAFFEQLGAVIISADKIARQLTTKDAPGWQKIKEAFGTGYFLTNCELDRKKLGELVFHQPTALKILNALLHPLIIGEIQQQKKSWPKTKVIIIEAPLLIEVGLHEDVDKLVVVAAPLDKRLERLSKRDGLSEAEIKIRLSSQMPLEEKLKMADIVIANKKNINNLKEEVERQWQEWSEAMLP